MGPLRELAAAHGAGEVEQAALTMLGYPAVMVTTGSEIETIRDCLLPTN